MIAVKLGGGILDGDHADQPKQDDIDGGCYFGGNAWREFAYDGLQNGGNG